MTSTVLPKPFVWRRLHSLMGLWIVLFLFEHLFVNSQAALLLGESGQGFVRMVNTLHDLPYLQAIELFLLGVPLAFHAGWGVKYLFTSKSNSRASDGTTPSLPQYGRNRAYTWQRFSSWILLVGILFHVTKFRFLDYPASLHQGEQSSYFVTLSIDQGLYTVASRLGVRLLDLHQIAEEREEVAAMQAEQTLVSVAETLQNDRSYDPQQQVILTSVQAYLQKKSWVEMLERQKIDAHHVVAVSSSFGTATLLTVRETFKNPWYVAFYTLFVLAACFHGFNGLWTFLITWGVVLKMSAQRGALKFTWSLMGLVAFLGLVSIWGTYFLNLRT